MIKLKRGECPKELTQDVCDELTKLYKENKDRDVWNSPKIKTGLKNALMEMSHRKCVYCECQLDTESKDVTIDHFLPKSSYPDLVVKWENIFPSCLRCNREKNDYEGAIVNPCLDDPRDYLGVSEKNRYRLRGLDRAGIGRNTILEINLNDIRRVMVPRMIEWEEIHQRLEELAENFVECGCERRYMKKLEILMDKCMEDAPYAAVKATNIMDDEYYVKIRDMVKAEGKWSNRLEMAECNIQEIRFRIV